MLSVTTNADQGFDLNASHESDQPMGGYCVGLRPPTPTRQEAFAKAFKKAGYYAGVRTAKRRVLREKIAKAKSGAQTPRTAARVRSLRRQLAAVRTPQ